MVYVVDDPPGILYLILSGYVSVGRDTKLEISQLPAINGSPGTPESHPAGEPQMSVIQLSRISFNS